MTKELFWGYIDYDEKIHIKKYTTDKAIRNAEDSGTTVGIFDPFYAHNLEEAANLILNKYREVKYKRKVMPINDAIIEGIIYESKE